MRRCTPTTLERAAQAVLTDAAAAGDASIVLADDEQLQALNLQYLEIDAPTDVLSFTSGELDPDTEVVYLGDVIISLDRGRGAGQLRAVILCWMNCRCWWCTACCIYWGMTTAKHKKKRRCGPARPAF